MHRFFLTARDGYALLAFFDLMFRNDKGRCPGGLALARPFPEGEGEGDVLKVFWLSAFLGACMSDELDDGVGEVAVGGEVVALRARLLQAELRTAAVRAGMVDLDGVRLIDLGGVAMDEAGGLVDGAGVMKAFRAAKPWLFGGSSSSSAVAPRAGAPGVKAAMAMSAEEWRVARAEILRRR